MHSRQAAQVVGILFFVLLFPCRCEEKKEPVTAILGAMTIEISLLENQLQEKQVRSIQGLRFVAGKLKGQQVVIAKSGVGKVNAAIATTLLLEHFKPREVIFTGIAGGIHPDLLPGDMVLGERTAQHDLANLTAKGYEYRGVGNPQGGNRTPVFFPADARLLGLADALSGQVKFEKISSATQERMPRIVKGVIVTGDVFVASVEKKAELRKNLQADAVEMEGAAVAQVCFQLGIPCLVIRSLSDTADANAKKDAAKFAEIAATNSARLVCALVEQLAVPIPPEKEKVP